MDARPPKRPTPHRARQANRRVDSAHLAKPVALNLKVPLDFSRRLHCFAQWHGTTVSTLVVEQLEPLIRTLRISDHSGYAADHGPPPPPAGPEGPGGA